MTSAFSNLKRTKRSPLPPLRRSSERNQDEVISSSSVSSFNLDLEDARDASKLDRTTRHAVISELRRNRKSTSLPSVQRKPAGVSSRPKTSDDDIVTSMAGRLAMVERELLAAKREIIEKDQTISNLEEHVSILQASFDRSGFHGDRSEVNALKNKCEVYLKQIEEMEEFLSDYGMTWVGSDGRGGEVYDKQDRDGRGETPKMWQPGVSVSGGPSIQFSEIVKNIKELNVLAGEGQQQVIANRKGARLEPVKAVPLTLYKNGLAMHSGPFRSYTDPTTQQFVQDLTEGYFPSELKQRYPNGVPFQLNDLRDTEYQPRNSKAFVGSGHQLGGAAVPSRVLPLAHYTKCPQENMKVTSELPERPVTLDRFLNKLPGCVIKNGKVIPIRSDIEEEFKCYTTTKSSTPEPTGMSQVSPCISSNEEKCNLRIKSENGEQVYTLTICYSSTVQELKDRLNLLRPKGALKRYTLRCNYPKRVLDDDQATLYEIGLFPTGNLFIDPVHHRH